MQRNTLQLFASAAICAVFFASQAEAQGRKIVIFKAGVPNAKEAIQFLLGQKPNEAWRHYVGVVPDVLFAAVKAIGQAFFVM